jgi:two-component system, chemotaxis family, chemotaxis protein CheY
MSKKKILIPKGLIFLVLEDTLTMREAVVNQLKKMGFSGQIFEAEKLAEAKDIIKNEKIEFIISDWNLPDGTGYDFLIEIRANPKYSKVPFLMVTTENGIKEVIDAIKEGASNYLIKPWEEVSFIEKLLYAWEKHQD